MQPHLEVTMFSQPSGNVRGLANVSVLFKGKKTHIGNATFFTDRPAELILKVPTKVAPTEMPVLLAGLSLFADKVNELDSGRPDSP